MPLSAPESLSSSSLSSLLATYAPLRPTSLCPELSAFHADDELPLWIALEAALGRQIDAPFFAVAWPGAQAVSRVLLDRDVDVDGAVVVDLGCGDGLAAVAAKRAGASRVIGVDVDPLAVAVTSLLAQAHDVEVEAVIGSLLHDDIEAIVAGADVVLAADLVYNRELGAALAVRAKRWLEAGKRVVLADSGRPFFDDVGLPVRARFSVPVPRGVEGRDVRDVRVFWR